MLFLRRAEKHTHASAAAAAAAAAAASGGGGAGDEPAAIPQAHSPARRSREQCEEHVGVAER